LENAKSTKTNPQEKSTMSINYLGEASFVEEEEQMQTQDGKN
jgi:hypothetical protein